MVKAHPLIIKYLKIYGSPVDQAHADRVVNKIRSSMEDNHEYIDHVNWESMAIAINHPLINEDTFIFVYDYGWECEDEVEGVSALWEVFSEMIKPAPFENKKLEDYL
jgi:hypothetical protein